MEQDKKVLIISQKDEQSTDKVLQYLFYHNTGFLRVNEDDIIQTTSVSIENTDTFRLIGNNFSIDIDAISSVWYRRGKINLIKKLPFQLSDEDYQIYIHYHQNSYIKEVDDLMQYIYSRLNAKKHINKYSDNSVSKVVQLKKALQNGLKVPKTLITDSIKTVLEYFKNSEIIFKSICWNLFRFSTNDGIKYRAGMETSKLVDKEYLKSLINKNIEKIHLSLFQEYIDKKFEIRVFYLNGKFFPMAIFSQRNEETMIDWRTENDTNRVSTFKLPQELETKINCFMNDLDLNCGSLDFIYTPSGEFIFLEVNPVGQFDWLTASCNYFIEKHIANELRSQI